jgi:pimeloyl-ACP methyl ester carboxylesterase
MPEVHRPDGATIYYEVHGSGYPLLLIAPGGVSSQVEIWQRSAINPIKEFAGDFMVIAMDQRHAGRSLAPMRPFSYDVCSMDQLAVLDAVGVPTAHVMGGCIGCAHVWRLVANAPGRISAAVAQDPVGLDETNSIETFNRMFYDTMRVARAEGLDAVIRAAEKDGMFVLNNAAGPFAPLLAASEDARQDLRALGRERYVQLVVEFRDGIWPNVPPYFTVAEDWMRSCPAPLLVLPGRDPFHPTGVARRICKEAPKARCLEVDCRDPAKLPDTIEAVRAFLKEHTPA